MVLTIFRTIHTPGEVSEWERAFWSTGLVVDDQILFSGDTRFDPTLFGDLDMSRIEAVFHDCQLFGANTVHATYDLLKTLPEELKKMMFLTHYGDNFERFDPPSEGFAGFARPFRPYLFRQR